jgi:hypothetical protein
MLLSRITVLMTFVALLPSQVPSNPSAQTSIDQPVGERVQGDTPVANCRVTLPADGVFEPATPVFGWSSSRTPDQFLYGTADLWAVLPADGILRGWGPDQPGDFAYHGKFAWYRTHAASLLQDGPVSLKGQRLDGPAPSFIETYPSLGFPGKHGTPAMAVMGMDIPVFGCWQFTGHHDDQDVTFTLWVTYSQQAASAHAYAQSLSSPRPKRTVQRVHIDPEVQAKELVYRVLPEIPAAAQATYGTVVLHAVIGTDGKTHELSYVSGPRLLAQAAIEAVRWWQYRINVVNLEPYEAQEVDTTISVLFSPP